MKYNNGFTLAEVLITLGIIGVVAALTIPALNANNQKAQYVTGLKKAYTEFNQALVQIAEDKGCIGDLKCAGIFGYDPNSYDAGADEYLVTTNNESLGTELIKYFKVVKNCESSQGGTTISGCFSDKISTRYDGGGTRKSLVDDAYYRFITSDGMNFALNNHSKNCENDASNHKTNNMTQLCGDVYIDINGLKGPNNLGRDIFFFWITNGKGPLLYPESGADDNWVGPWKDSSGNILKCYLGSTNSGCAGRVIEEGWQMNY